MDRFVKVDAIAEFSGPVLVAAGIEEFGPMKKRNSSTEFFRCVLMFMVVLYHGFDHGLWQGSHEWWYVLLSSLLIWHVDGFVAISGWYGIKTTWRKVIALWGMFVFYSLLNLFWCKLRGLPCHPMISGGWFGNTYLFLMFLAPFLNGGVRLLFESGKRELLMAWLGLAFVFTAQWLPIGVKVGICHTGEAVFSLFTLAFVYLTARVAKLLLADKIRERVILLGTVVFLLGMVIPFSSMAGVSRLHNYRAPYVWGMALAMLLLFEGHIRLPNRIGNLVNYLAPSMFGVYLFHITTEPGKLTFVEPQKWFSSCGFGPLVSIFGAAVFCFVLSLVVDLCRRWCVELIYCLWRRIRGDGKSS